MVKVEAIYKPQGKNEPKFSHIKATIGDKVYEPVPISFLRVSELKALEEMLNTAVEFGRKQNG